MPVATELCACTACKCQVEPQKAITQAGKHYCSQACADGHKNQVSCGHAGCNC